MSNCIYIAVDDVIGYTRVRDARSGTYLNAGTATYSLKTQGGTVVASGNLVYDAGSNGNYYATIQSTVDTSAYLNGPLNLEVTFAQSGYNDFRRIPLIVTYRGSE